MNCKQLDKAEIKSVDFGFKIAYFRIFLQLTYPGESLREQ